MIEIPCYVKINSEKEFRDVEKVFQDIGIDWAGLSDGLNGYSSMLDTPFYTGIATTSDNKIYLYSGHITVSKSISAPEFIKKYGKTKQKKFRIKTEQEFIDEFGNGWKDIVEWNDLDKMDYLFGKELTDEQIDRFKTNKRFGLDKWFINREMVKEIEVDKNQFHIKPIQKLKEVIFGKEEPFKLNNSLYKLKRPNLNQNY